MARKVLNAPASTSQGAILSVSNTKTTTYVTSETNNNWNIAGGYKWNFEKKRTDSYAIAKMSWQGGEQTHSYFAGMGLRAIRPSGNSHDRYGWSYYWRHNGSNGDGDDHLFSMMSGWAPSDFANETGNMDMRIGWSSANGSNNKPSARWCETRSQDNRGHADLAYYSWMIEVHPDNMNWQTNSGGYG